MPTNKKGRDLSRLGLVGTQAAGAAWQSLVTAAEQPGERLESARELPIELIAPFAGQPRKHFDSERLASLAESIREDGIIQPIVVRAHPEQADHFVIVAGERRWRAARLARLTRVPVVIIEDGDDVAAARMMLRENIEREDLDIEDLGLYLQTLVEAGATQRELAALTHYSLGKINGLLKLARHPDLLEKIRNGQLTQEQAIDLVSGQQRQAASAPPAPRRVPDVTLNGYRPLDRVTTWATAFKAHKVPPERRAALRAQLQETMDRLTALYHALDEEPEHEEGPAVRPPQRGGTGGRR